MAQSIKFLPCMHKDPSSIPQNPCLNNIKTKETNEKNTRKPIPVIPALGRQKKQEDPGQTSSRPMRDSVKEQGGSLLRLSSGFHWTAHTHISTHTNPRHTHTHTSDYSHTHINTHTNT